MKRLSIDASRRRPESEWLFRCYSTPNNDFRHRLGVLGAGVRVERAATRCNRGGDEHKCRDDEQNRPKRDARLMM